MTVFRGYLLIIRRNIGTILMYLAIFLTVTIIIEKSYLNMGASTGFSATKMNVAVIDREGGELANALRMMMERDQNLVELEDDPQIIQEELYYGNVEYVLIVPEDASEKLRQGAPAVQSVTDPGSVMSYYAQAEVNNLLNQIRVYLAGGNELSAACEKAVSLGDTQAEVNLLDVNGNGGVRENYNYFTAYLPYAFLCSSIMSLSLIIMEFKKREIRNRLESSAVPFYQQTMATLAAFALTGFGIWCIYIGIQAVLYQDGIFTSVHAGLYVCNTLVCILVALSLGFLTGTVSTGPVSLNGINNVVSLGFCFLGGIFVPLEMLGDKIRKVSQFLPTYWYSMINGLLGDYHSLNSEMMRTIRKGLLIQLLFATACFSITLLIRRRQMQES